MSHKPVKIIKWCRRRQQIKLNTLQKAIEMDSHEFYINSIKGQISVFKEMEIYCQLPIVENLGDVLIKIYKRIDETEAKIKKSPSKRKLSKLSGKKTAYHQFVSYLRPRTKEFDIEIPKSKKILKAEKRRAKRKAKRLQKRKSNQVAPEIFVKKSKNGHVVMQDTLYGSTPSGDYLRLKKHLKKQELDSIMYAKYSSDAIDFSKLTKKQKSLHQMFFNTKVLEDLQKEFGSLRCVYCGQENLVIYHWQDPNKKTSDMATIDHFNPKDNDGGAYDKDNMVCSCHDCNRKKSNKLYPLSSLKYLHHYCDEKILKEKLSYEGMPINTNRYGYHSLFKLENDFFQLFEQMCYYLELNKKSVSKRKNQWISLIKANRLTCVVSGKEAAYLSYDVQHLKNGGKSYHWNFYTNDHDLLTIDHIIPKSKGGSVMNSENLQIMIAEDNWEKSNKL